MTSSELKKLYTLFRSPSIENMRRVDGMFCSATETDRETYTKYISAFLTDPFHLEETGTSHVQVQNALTILLHLHSFMPNCLASLKYYKFTTSDEMSATLATLKTELIAPK
jgi:hypothetical protein